MSSPLGVRSQDRRPAGWHTGSEGEEGGQGLLPRHRNLAAIDQFMVCGQMLIEHAFEPEALERLRLARWPSCDTTSGFSIACFLQVPGRELES
jgi:hypothetical protein